MILQNVISRVDEIKPNAFSDETKTEWLNECEGMVQTQVMLLAPDEIVTYTYAEHAKTELLVKAPHDKIYRAYLCAMVDFANGEYNKYQNSMAMFNAYFNEFAEWYTMLFRPADGGMVWQGYYLSAYGLAVKHGFKGTEEEWLASLTKGSEEALDAAGAAYTAAREALDAADSVKSAAENGEYDGAPGAPGASVYVAFTADGITMTESAAAHSRWVGFAQGYDSRPEDVDAYQWVDLNGAGSSVTVDDALSIESENPVQNKVLTAALNPKEETSRKQKDYDLGKASSCVYYPSMLTLQSAADFFLGALFPYKVKFVPQLPDSAEAALDTIYIIRDEEGSDSLRVFKKKEETVSYLLVVPTYVEGSGPASGLYIKGADDIDDIAAGTKLYYSGTQDLTSASELEANVFGTIESTIDIEGVTHFITSGGGTVFTCVKHSVVTLVNDIGATYNTVAVTEDTDLTPYLQTGTLGRVLYDKRNDAVGDIETLLGGI